MSALADFHFLRPMWLLLLLALPLLWLGMRSGNGDAGGWRSVVDRQLLPYLLDGQSSAGSRGGPTLAALVFVLACLALAGPAWERQPMPLYRNQAARVIALELAPSMLAQDVKPDRLDRVRYKIDDLLKRSRDYQTALIGYAGEAFVAAPLTDDINTVRNLVQALDPSVMPVTGNATAKAIERGVQLIKQAGLAHGEVIVIADSVGPDAADAAGAASTQGVSVSVLGVGTTAGAPVALPDGSFLKDASGAIVLAKLDPAALREVALAGGGHYATVTPDGSDLDSVLADRNVDQATGAERESLGKSNRYRDRGPWLLLLVLPLALVGFRRGWLMAFALMAVSLVAIVPTQRAQAASLSDLWLRSDQQAARALQDGDAKQAMQVAKSPDWRGSAAYRAGNYATAAQAFTQAQGANAAYNEGNALAKMGKYQEAIAAYDRALIKTPDMDDATVNRNAVEDWLKRQQNQQKQDQDPKDHQGNQKQDASQKPDQSQSQGGKDQSGQGDQKQNQQQGQDKQQQQDKQGKDQQSQQQKDAESKAAKQDQQQGKSAEDNAQSKEQPSQQPSDQQQQALKRAIDKALTKSGKDDKPGEPAQVATPQDNAKQEQQQAMQQWLERVPDDPGGLLRRKFMLEYQRRMQSGGGGQ